jgi:hypothetical protein
VTGFVIALVVALVAVIAVGWIAADLINQCDKPETLRDNDLEQP